MKQGIYEQARWKRERENWKEKSWEWKEDSKPNITAGHHRKRVISFFSSPTTVSLLKHQCIGKKCTFLIWFEEAAASPSFCSSLTHFNVLCISFLGRFVVLLARFGKEKSISSCSSWSLTEWSFFSFRIYEEIEKREPRFFRCSLLSLVFFLGETFSSQNVFKESLPKEAEISQEMTSECHTWINTQWRVYLVKEVTKKLRRKERDVQSKRPWKRLERRQEMDYYFEFMKTFVSRSSGSLNLFFLHSSIHSSFQDIFSFPKSSVLFDL